MLPTYDCSIAFVKAPLVIGDTNDIIASNTYIIISPSITPYIIPPNLSNCFITGSFAINKSDRSHVVL